MRHLLSVCLLLLATPAFAQDADERIDQLEQDVMILKRQRERVSGASSGGSDGAGISNAQMDVRIGAIEEELRGMRGKLEEKEFETRRLSEELEKLKRDIEFRMGELEKNAGAAAAPAPAPAPQEENGNGDTKKPDISLKEVPVKEDGTPAESKADAGMGETSRDHYNYAFRLLNQNQYDDAAKSFESFVKKYPKDPLVGNAYYWQGETYYIRKDYKKASDYFRQGFESMPKGPKAADNLLKLGMSLAAMKKTEEACIVLGQVMSKYKTSASSVASKAQTEHKRAGCAA